jgi:malonyl-CoA decarboxylase
MRSRCILRDFLRVLPKWFWRKSTGLNHVDLTRCRLGRNQIEHLAAIVADHVQRAATTGALLVLDIDDDLVARQVRGQRTAIAVGHLVAPPPLRWFRRVLGGVSFGNLLIKQVVEELRAELPQLTRFSTLSPVRRFRRWLEKRLAAGEAPDAAVLAALKTEGWWPDAARSEALCGPLLRLCATYLTGAEGPKGSIDPVARFHLSKGARLERVNWLGNVAPRGIEESYGIMVNYLYDPKTIEANHEAFAHDGMVVCLPEVNALIVPAAPPVGIAADGA